ncbi:MAG: response regulator transcription factor [Chloroflexota bacterium]
MSQVISVIIVDDHHIVREGLHALISTEQGLNIVGEASNGHDAIRLVNEKKPDVMLLDLMMEPMGGIEVIERVMAQDTDIKVLVLTSFGNENLVFQAIKAGAHGYLLKDTPPNVLAQSIYDVYNGILSLAPSVASLLIQEIRETPTPNLPQNNILTKRETLILKHVAQGLTNREIADILVISERTVRTHITNILGKLHLANRTQAALYALREGIASLDS